MTGSSAVTGVILHATTVSFGGKALLIQGPSGSGKSALALQLMAFGATLVADDQTQIERRGDVLWAECPPGTRGIIEARDVGILAAETANASCIVLAVDLAQTEATRLPPERHITILGCAIPLLFKVNAPHFPAALLQYLKSGRTA